MRFLIIICLQCCFVLSAFSQKVRSGRELSAMQDTVAIRKLLRQASALVYKPGERKADLQAAQSLLDQVFKKSRQIADSNGIRIANDIQVQLFLETNNRSKAAALLPELRPSKRIELIKELIMSYIGEQQTDSAFYYARMMKSEGQRNHLPDVANEAEYYLSRCHYQRHEWREVKECYLNMIRYHRANHDLIAEAKAWEFLAASTSETDTTYPTKEFSLRQTMMMALRRGDKLQSALSLAELGRVHFAYGAIDLAEGELLTADEQLKALGVQERSFVYECLSRLYVQKANGGKALYYAQATLENMRLNGKWSSDNAFYYVRVAEVYLTFGQTERYHSTLFKMLEGRNPATETDNYYVVLFARQINLKQGPAEAINYLSARLTNKKIFNDSADIAVGHMYIGDFYRQLGQSQKAMEYYLVAEKEMIPNDLYRRTAPLELNLRLATQLYDQGKYTNALEYLDKVRWMQQAGPVPLRKQIEMYGLYYRIDSIQGRYQSALRNYALTKMISDSVFNIEKWGQIEELQLKYETARKDQELQQRAHDIAWLTEQGILREALFEQKELSTRQREMLKDRDIAQAQQQARQRGDSLRNKEERIALLDKKSELQQVLLDQTRTTRNIIIIGSVLAVLLFWVIYYQKQRSNGQLKKQQELIKNKNETLEKLLSEKEWLLKEVHHRVKNNLQVVMSLLNIQSFYLQDDNAISAIRDSQRRVNAISLIHKKLYLSDNPALVDMQLYIKELVDHLREYADDRRGITFGLSIDPISLDVGQALPVGLILNEAITNAFKYAFTVGNSGKIQVVLKNGPEEGWLTLLVADNGVGMDQASSAMQDSLGMNLMKGLAKDMDGTLVLQNQDGLSITVMFPAETEVRHHARSSEIIQA